VPKTRIPFDGAAYAPVAARITLFYAQYPEGRILTRLVEHGPDVIVFQASVYRESGDRDPAATGWASERIGDGEINSVACLENTETSAIGRALANLGFTASIHRPSVEEMQKAERARARQGRRDKPYRDDQSDGDRSGGVARRTAIHEPLPPSEFDAPSLVDAVEILDASEREGLDPRRVSRLRTRLLLDDVTPHPIERLERALRKWLDRFDAVL